MSKFRKLKMLNILKNSEKCEAFVLRLGYKIITAEKLAKFSKVEKFMHCDRASDFVEF